MAGNSTWDGGVGKSAHGAARLPDIGSAAQWFPPSGGLVRLVVECRSYHRMAHVWNICQVDDILIIIIIMIITINIIIVIMIFTDKDIYTCLFHSYIQNKNLERQGDRHVMTHIRSSERLGLWQPDRPNLQDVPCHVRRSSCGWRSFSGSSSRPRQWTLSCYMCIYDYL
jgi:hypothetical protein